MDWRERFWYKVTPNDETGCWEWNGPYTRSGYGMLTVDKKVKRSHRLVWEMLVGPIPNDGSAHGICVCHKCDNPKCVNINHLFLGTMADNVRDRDAKNRFVCNKTKTIRETGKCLSGRHDWVPENIRRTKQGRNLCLACNRETKRRHNQAVAP